MIDKWTVIAIITLLVYFISLPFIAIAGYRMKRYWKRKEGEWFEEGRNKANKCSRRK